MAIILTCWIKAAFIAQCCYKHLQYNTTIDKVVPVFFFFFGNHLQVRRELYFLAVFLSKHFLNE